MGYCLHHSEKEIAKLTHCISGSFNEYLASFTFKLWTNSSLCSSPSAQIIMICGCGWNRLSMFHSWGRPQRCLFWDRGFLFPQHPDSRQVFSLFFFFFSLVGKRLAFFPYRIICMPSKSKSDGVFKPICIIMYAVGKHVLLIWICPTDGEDQWYLRDQNSQVPSCQSHACVFQTVIKLYKKMRNSRVCVWRSGEFVQ